MLGLTLATLLTLSAHAPTLLSRSLPLPPTLEVREAREAFARHIRRFPSHVEDVVEEMPDKEFAQVFGADFATLVEEQEAGSGPAPPVSKSAEALEVEKVLHARVIKYCMQAWKLPAAERWGSAESLWYNAPPRTAAIPSAAELEPPPPAALRTAMDALSVQCGTDASFAACASLLLKYSDNAAAEPTIAKFRTVKSSAKVFSRLLAPHSAASECLQVESSPEDHRLRVSPLWRTSFMVCYTGYSGIILSPQF